MGVNEIYRGYDKYFYIYKIYNYGAGEKIELTMYDIVGKEYFMYSIDFDTSGFVYDVYKEYWYGFKLLDNYNVLFKKINLITQEISEFTWSFEHNFDPARSGDNVFYNEDENILYCSITGYHFVVSFDAQIATFDCEALMHNIYYVDISKIIYYDSIDNDLFRFDKNSKTHSYLFNMSTFFDSDNYIGFNNNKLYSYVYNGQYIKEIDLVTLEINQIPMTVELQNLKCVHYYDGRYRLLAETPVDGTFEFQFESYTLDELDFKPNVVFVDNNMYWYDDFVFHQKYKEQVIELNDEIVTEKNESNDYHNLLFLNDRLVVSGSPYKQLSFDNVYNIITSFNSDGKILKGIGNGYVTYQLDDYKFAVYDYDFNEIHIGEMDYLIDNMFIAVHNDNVYTIGSDDIFVYNMKTKQYQLLQNIDIDYNYKLKYYTIIDNKIYMFYVDTNICYRIYTYSINSNSLQFEFSFDMPYYSTGDTSYQFNNGYFYIYNGKYFGIVNLKEKTVQYYELLKLDDRYPQVTTIAIGLVNDKITGYTNNGFKYYFNNWLYDKQGKYYFNYDLNITKRNNKVIAMPHEDDNREDDYYNILVTINNNGEVKELKPKYFDKVKYKFNDFYNYSDDSIMVKHDGLLLQYDVDSNGWGKIYDITELVYFSNHNVDEYIYSFGYHEINHNVYCDVYKYGTLYNRILLLENYSKCERLILGFYYNGNFYLGTQWYYNDVGALYIVNAGGLQKIVDSNFVLVFLKKGVVFAIEPKGWGEDIAHLIDLDNLTISKIENVRSYRSIYYIFNDYNDDYFHFKNFIIDLSNKQFSYNDTDDISFYNLDGMFAYNYHIEHYEIIDLNLNKVISVYDYFYNINRYNYISSVMATQQSNNIGYNGSIYSVCIAEIYNEQDDSYIYKVYLIKYNTNDGLSLTELSQVKELSRVGGDNYYTIRYGIENNILHFFAESLYYKYVGSVNLDDLSYNINEPPHEYIMYNYYFVVHYNNKIFGFNADSNQYHFIYDIQTNTTTKLPEPPDTDGLWQSVGRYTIKNIYYEEGDKYVYFRHAYNDEIYFVRFDLDNYTWDYINTHIPVDSTSQAASVFYLENNEIYLFENDKFYKYNIDTGIAYLLNTVQNINTGSYSEHKNFTSFVYNGKRYICRVNIVISQNTTTIILYRVEDNYTVTQLYSFTVLGVFYCRYVIPNIGGLYLYGYGNTNQVYKVSVNDGISLLTDEIEYQSDYGWGAFLANKSCISLNLTGEHYMVVGGVVVRTVFSGDDESSLIVNSLKQYFVGVLYNDLLIKLYENNDYVIYNYLIGPYFDPNLHNSFIVFKDDNLTFRSYAKYCYFTTNQIIYENYGYSLDKTNYFKGFAKYREITNTEIHPTSYYAYYNKIGYYSFDEYLLFKPDQSCLFKYDFNNNSINIINTTTPVDLNFNLKFIIGDYASFLYDINELLDMWLHYNIDNIYVYFYQMFTGDKLFYTCTITNNNFYTTKDSQIKFFDFYTQEIYYQDYYSPVSDYLFKYQDVIYYIKLYPECNKIDLYKNKDYFDTIEFNYDFINKPGVIVYPMFNLNKEYEYIEFYGVDYVKYNLKFKRVDEKINDFISLNDTTQIAVANSTLKLLSYIEEDGVKLIQFKADDDNYTYIQTPESENVFDGIVWYNDNYVYQYKNYTLYKHPIYKVILNEYEINNNLFNELIDYTIRNFGFYQSITHNDKFDNISYIFGGYDKKGNFVNVLRINGDRGDPFDIFNNPPDVPSHYGAMIDRLNVFSQPVENVKVVYNPTASMPYILYNIGKKLLISKFDEDLASFVETYDLNIKNIDYGYCYVSYARDGVEKNMICIVGGKFFVNNYLPYNFIYLYDVDTGQVIEQQVEFNNLFHPIVVEHGNLVYVFGGYDANDNINDKVYVIEIFDDYVINYKACEKSNRIYIGSIYKPDKDNKIQIIDITDKGYNIVYELASNYKLIDYGFCANTEFVAVVGGKNFVNNYFVDNNKLLVYKITTNEYREIQLPSNMYNPKVDISGDKILIEYNGNKYYYDWSDNHFGTYSSTINDTTWRISFPNDSKLQYKQFRDEICYIPTDYDNVYTFNTDTFELNIYDVTTGFQNGEFVYMYNGDKIYRYSTKSKDVFGLLANMDFTKLVYGNNKLFFYDLKSRYMYSGNNNKIPYYNLDTKYFGYYEIDGLDAYNLYSYNQNKEFGYYSGLYITDDESCIVCLHNTVDPKSSDKRIDITYSVYKMKTSQYFPDIPIGNSYYKSTLQYSQYEETIALKTVFLIKPSLIYSSTPYKNNTIYYYVITDGQTDFFVNIDIANNTSSIGLADNFVVYFLYDTIMLYSYSAVQWWNNIYITEYSLISKGWDGKISMRMYSAPEVLSDFFEYNGNLYCRRPYVKVKNFLKDFEKQFNYHPNYINGYYEITKNNGDIIRVPKLTTFSWLYKYDKFVYNITQNRTEYDYHIDATPGCGALYDIVRDRLLFITYDDNKPYPEMGYIDGNGQYIFVMYMPLTDKIITIEKIGSNIYLIITHKEMIIFNCNNYTYDKIDYIYQYGYDGYYFDDNLKFVFLVNNINDERVVLEFNDGGYQVVRTIPYDTPIKTVYMQSFTYNKELIRLGFDNGLHVYFDQDTYEFLEI